MNSEEGFDDTVKSHVTGVEMRTDKFEPGQLIDDKYKLLELIGSGGMGTVYRVEHIFLGKEFALKLLHFDRLTDIAIRRFQQEAKTTAQLQHPNLVEVHDFGVLNENQPYLVMDLIVGITLQDHLRSRGSIPASEAIAIVIQASFGLLYAHERRVVHRDIKPGNIVLTKPAQLASEESIKIVDFGIAKLIQSEDGEVQALTRTGEIFGSPIYMSPEQCKGSLVDHRSDIYSLGCVFFQLLTGAPPFLADTAAATMMKRLAETAPTLKEGSFGQVFPERLEQTVAKMLSLNPGDRYQSLAQVVEDLIRIDDEEKKPPDKQTQKVPVGKRFTMHKFPGSTQLALVIVALLSSGLTAAFDQWRFSNSAVLPQSDSQARNTVVLDADNLKAYPSAEVLENSSRRFHFGEIDYGFVEWRDKRFRAYKDVDVPSLEPVKLVITNKTQSRDPKLLSNFEVDEIGGIDLSVNDQVDNKSLNPVNRLTNLTDVNLNHTSVSSLKPLARLAKLSSLQVLDTLVSTKELIDLRQLLDLQTLSFGPVSEPSRIIKYLSNSKQLANLSIEGPGVSNADIATISRMPQLVSLSIRKCPEVTDQGLKPLANMKRLSCLIIRDCSISGKIVPFFSRFEHFKKNGLQATTTGWTKREKEQFENLPFALIIESKSEKSQRKSRDLSDLYKSIE